MQFSLDRKQRRHKQNQCSASDSVGLIFTRSYRSTLLIMTPTTTPSLVKTSLKLYMIFFAGKGWGGGGGGNSWCKNFALTIKPGPGEWNALSLFFPAHDFPCTIFSRIFSCAGFFFLAQGGGNFVEPCLPPQKFMVCP